MAGNFNSTTSTALNPRVRLGHERRSIEMSKRITSHLAVLLVVMLLLAACGGDVPATSTSVPAAPTATATTQPASTPTMEATPAPVTEPVTTAPEATSTV